METVEQRSAGRDNNFNLLRMVAATAVLVSHAWPLALGKDTIEPLFLATGYKLGTSAVTIFFAVSGFFITKSFDRRASLADFAFARVARIYPALIVVLLLTVFVLGPIFTARPLAEYFRARHTWTYLPENLLLFRLQWALPGVFKVNISGTAINGSLWTLFPEVSCYALVVVAGLTRLSRPPTFPIVLLTAIVPTFVVAQTEAGGLFHAASIMTLPFALGAGAYVYRRHVPVSGLVALAFAGFAALSYATPFYPAIHALALSYGALWFGLARIPGLHRYNRLGDYSYGMYIYAFPVAQMCVAVVPHLTPVQLALLSFPPTLLLAIVSWTLIESPALAHRHLLFARWRLRRIEGIDAATLPPAAR